MYDRRYGTLREPVEAVLEGGGSILLDIDMLGHRQVRSSGLDAVHVLLLPPDLRTLEARLRGRGTDDEAVIQSRMAQVEDNLDTAHKCFQGVLLAALCHRSARAGLVRDVQGWLEDRRG